MVQKSAYFVSDLHMFARRSNAQAHTAAIHDHARQAHTFVLGGDIFDFRWSTVGGLSQTVGAAANWLDDLVRAAPACRFHFLLGNHDHHDAMIGQLMELEGDHENLWWDPYLVRLGDSVFLHGDAADGDGTHTRLVQSRQGDNHHRRRGAAASIAYDAVLKTRIHRTIPVVAYPKKRTARRLLGYLDEVGHGRETGVQNVYFGHTHRAVHNYGLQGVKFHNGGAPIHGVPFRIVRAEAPPS